MGRASFTLSVVPSPPEATVRVTGELDLCAAAPLSEALAEAVAAGCREFSVDLDPVTFADASCVDVFVSLARRLQSEDGSLTFAAVSSWAHRAFTVAGAGVLLDGTHRKPLHVVEPRPPWDQGSS